MAQKWNLSSPTTEYYDHTSPGLEPVVKEVIDSPEVAIDTETTGLVIYRDIPLYFSLAWGNRRMALNISAIHAFKQAFADPTKRWIFANAKYDAHMLANIGTFIAGKLIDVQVMHSLLYEEMSHRLKDINQHLFGWRWADFEDTFGAINKAQTAEARIRRAERENFDLLCEYAANDAWGTWQVYLELRKQLMKAPTHSLFRGAPLHIETLWDLFEKVEMPYTKVLWKNERNGVLIDREYLHKIEPKVKQGIDDLSKSINKEAGTVINPSSPAQLRAYFFDRLRLSPLKMSKGGKTGVRNPSVDEGFLTHYSATVPMADMLLQHRSLSKLYGTYIVGISEYIDSSGRIHTTFNQDVARTGRLSSKEPNIQQIPKPENDKWKMRGAFVVEDGNDMIVADYEQLEMRLLACASLEAGMIDVINRGWDIHMGNASMIFGIPYDEIKAAKQTDKLVSEGKLPASDKTDRVIECLLARSSAKDIGFGLIYGMGPAKLARSIGCSKAEAESKIAQFEAAYPAAKAFREEAVNETLKTGYAFTILGRRRNVVEIASYRKDEQMKGERIATNTQIQGSAADVCKMAQILLDKIDLEGRYGCRPLMQVHDELANECPKETSALAQQEIKDWMEHPFPIDLAVGLKVSINRGHSWLEAK